nr:transglycosylase SLT domain-containing protein [Chlorobium phaeobacteroides]
MRVSHVYRVPLLLCVLLTAVYSNGFAARNDREPDDTKVAEILDRLVTSEYFSDSHFKEWKDGGVNGYPPLFIPQFDDQTYLQRIAQLNSRTQLELVYNSHVKSFIRLYSVDKRRLTAKILGLTELYFPLFEEKLRQYRIPLELKYLAIVESALNPSAVSSANAKGLWQFIYGTGKMYGLESSPFVEDRFDPEQATVA